MKKRKKKRKEGKEGEEREEKKRKGERIEEYSIVGFEAKFAKATVGFVAII